jgi:hypothetical protein
MQGNATAAQNVINPPCHAITAVAGIMMRDNLPPGLPGFFAPGVGVLRRSLRTGHGRLAQMNMTGDRSLPGPRLAPHFL